MQCSDRSLCIGKVGRAFSLINVQNCESQNYVVNKGIMKNVSIWIEPMDFRLEYAAGNRYFIILPSLQRDGYYYKHIASVEVQVCCCMPRVPGPASLAHHVLHLQDNGAAGSIHFLTEGTWEVIQIVGYSSERNTM